MIREGGVWVTAAGSELGWAIASCAHQNDSKAQMITKKVYPVSSLQVATSRLAMSGTVAAREVLLRRVRYDAKSVDDHQC